jgi:hypothetical protein
MDKLSQYFLIIIALLVGVIGVEQCRSFQNHQKPETVKVDGKKYELVSRKIDTVYITKTNTMYRPGKDIPYEVLVEKPIYISSQIDTTIIIRNYFSNTIYKDTLKIDSIGYISIIDTLNKNKISGRSYSYEIKQPTIKEYTIVKELPRNQFYLGGNILVGNSRVMAGTQILWKTKSDNIYGIDAYVDPYGKQYYGLSLNWKIKLKK